MCWCSDKSTYNTTTAAEALALFTFLLYYIMAAASSELDLHLPDALNIMQHSFRALYLHPPRSSPQLRRRAALANRQA